MSVLPPAEEGPEALASFVDDQVDDAGFAGSVWHGWVIANMDADCGEEVGGDVVMPYQLSSSGDEGPLTPLRLGARVVFALYAQEATIGTCDSVLLSTTRLRLLFSARVLVYLLTCLLLFAFRCTVLRPYCLVTSDSSCRYGRRCRCSCDRWHWHNQTSTMGLQTSRQRQVIVP